jgi:anti-sigma regulatory factor (Ser/Thr protein kinase)
MANFGDIIESKGRDIDLIIQEVGLMKQLIKERSHPLSLLRELISNSGAKEVGATEVKIKYTIDEEGHIFEVTDNGCGMDYTGQKMIPGRLDKFLGLGLSTIVGIKSDEFSWKGLGSKLAYQSRRIEIDTWCGRDESIKVEINEPWSSIERNLIPKPKIFMYKPEEGRKTGTSIKVFGHPPHRK